MASSSPFASWLRKQPALVGEPPALVLEDLPDDPIALFIEWMKDAAARGVAEPHAATLATVDADGAPDARTLLVKDVSARGWAFAGPRGSVKGSQLSAAPVAAMNFWWQPVRRAVRVRGAVQEASALESEADLAEQSAAARAGIAAGEWVRWWLEPSRIEFWQGATDRRHVRIVYMHERNRWTRAIGSGESSREGG